MKRLYVLLAIGLLTAWFAGYVALTITAALGA